MSFIFSWVILKYFFISQNNEYTNIYFYCLTLWLISINIQNGKKQ